MSRSELSASWGDVALRLPALHAVFGLPKRWLLGTHHGPVGKMHLGAYLDEIVFGLNQRTAKNLCHRFGRASGPQPTHHLPCAYHPIRASLAIVDSQRA